MFQRVKLPLMAALLLGAAPAVRADNLDEKLIAQTLKLTDYIKSKKATTVGVLKFRFQKGDGPLTFRGSPIATVLAERLETVLIMAPVNKKKPLQVIRDASRVAAESKQGINYLKAEGRKKLFALTYPLAAGNRTARPDLFLTGVVMLDPKSHKTKVVIAGFGKDSARVEPIGVEFEVKTDRAILADAGQGFVLNARSLRTKLRGPQGDLFAEEDATDREEKKKEPVSQSKEKLVELEKFINDEPVPFVPDPDNPGEDRFTARDPKENDKVKFVLTNKSQQRVAVVLKVNGMNTLYQQKDEALRCNKWVLNPGDAPLTIDGFYVNDTGKESKLPFVVKPDADSEQEVLADESQGTIELHVFVEGGGTAPKEEEQVTTRGLSRRQWAAAQRGLARPADAQSLLMKRQSKTRTKGLIAPDQNAVDGSKLKTVEFNDPQQQQCLIIRYYKKSSGSGG